MVAAACSPPIVPDAAVAEAAAGPARDDGGRGAVTVRYWAAGCSVSDDLWRFRKESTTVTCDARGRFLEGTRGELVWPDYVEASEIDTLTVEGEALDALRFELWWSTDDSFAPERSALPIAGTEAGQVRFDLTAAPEWQGRVRRFRLTWTGAASISSRILGAWATKHAPRKG